MRLSVIPSERYSVLGSLFVNGKTASELIVESASAVRSRRKAMRENAMISTTAAAAIAAIFRGLVQKCYAVTKAGAFTAGASVSVVPRLLSTSSSRSTS